MIKGLKGSEEIKRKTLLHRSQRVKTFSWSLVIVTQQNALLHSMENIAAMFNCSVQQCVSNKEDLYSKWL